MKTYSKFDYQDIWEVYERTGIKTFVEGFDEIFELFFLRVRKFNSFPHRIYYLKNFNLIKFI